VSRTPRQPFVKTGLLPGIKGPITGQGKPGGRIIAHGVGAITIGGHG
jgi:hypothetical protein